MEKLINLFFSNIFIIIIVIAGISNFLKKIMGNENKPGSNSKTQKTFGNQNKKFNIFDFDLEKWIKEQTGQLEQMSKPKSKSSEPTGDIGRNVVDYSNFRTNDQQQVLPAFESKMTLNTKVASLNSTVNEVESAEKQFDIDITDMQRAVIMAEVLGPPRSKRKSFRY